MLVTVRPESSAGRSRWTTGVRILYLQLSLILKICDNKIAATLFTVNERRAMVFADDEFASLISCLELNRTNVIRNCIHMSAWYSGDRNVADAGTKRAWAANEQLVPCVEQADIYPIDRLARGLFHSTGDHDYPQL